jgi:hypothetical protein
VLVEKKERAMAEVIATVIARSTLSRTIFTNTITLCCSSGLYSCRRAAHDADECIYNGGTFAHLAYAKATRHRPLGFEHGIMLTVLRFKICYHISMSPLPQHVVVLSLSERHTCFKHNVEPRHMPPSQHVLTSTHSRNTVT